jgi:hypothetical protein
VNYEDLLEIKKRMEFNKTEPEVLVHLVDDAIGKGEKAQKDLDRLGLLSSQTLDLMQGRGWLLTDRDLADVVLKHTTTVGIDGSYKIVGGPGGKWYAPMSVVRIIFEKGLGQEPKVDVYWAGIQEIDEQADANPEAVASVMMLVGETKAILNWGSPGRESYVMIDGPVMDPPFLSLGGVDYVKDRAAAISQSFADCSLIGVVKRSRDTFYIRYLQQLAKDEEEKEKLNQFPSDQHLLLFVFSRYRSNGYKGPIFTNWIDISDTTPLTKIYKGQGIGVSSFFFQKGPMSQVLRVDVPFKMSPSEETPTFENQKHVLKALDLWTYPGQDYPVPVYLAHEKCSIREGCADVLYQEIMTRGHLTNPHNQIVMDLLR